MSPATRERRGAMRRRLESRAMLCIGDKLRECLCRDFGGRGLGVVVREDLADVGDRLVVRLTTPDVLLTGRVVRVRGRSRWELGLRLDSWSWSAFRARRALRQHLDRLDACGA